MQEAQAHSSLVYHQHPHTERSFSWEDALFISAVLTLAWVMKPLFFKGKRTHGLERNSRR